MKGKTQDPRVLECVRGQGVALGQTRQGVHRQVPKDYTKAYGQQDVWLHLLGKPDRRKHVESGVGLYQKPDLRAYSRPNGFNLFQGKFLGLDFQREVRAEMMRPFEVASMPSGPVI